MSKEKVNMSKTRELKILTSGALAGMVSRTCTAPIERIKVLRQTRNKYYIDKTFVQSFAFMYEKEGLKGFFKGNGANVIRVTPFAAIEFTTFDFLRYRINKGAPLTTIKLLRNYLIFQFFSNGSCFGCCFIFFGIFSIFSNKF